MGETFKVGTTVSFNITLNKRGQPQAQQVQHVEDGAQLAGDGSAGGAAAANGTADGAGAGAGAGAPGFASEPDVKKAKTVHPQLAMGQMTANATVAAESVHYAQDNVQGGHPAF